VRKKSDSSLDCERSYEETNLSGGNW